MDKGMNVESEKGEFNRQHSVNASDGDLASNLAFLKSNLFKGAQSSTPVSGEQSCRRHNHLNVTLSRPRRLKSTFGRSQTLKMSFTNASNETFMVTRIFSTPIDALTAYKNAKIAEKSYGKLHSYALIDNHYPR